MRNSTRCSTPKTNTAHDESNSNNAEKTSSKKLKQARLPFKIIDPGASPVDTKIFGSLAASDKEKGAVKDAHTLDVRKRKLSYDTEDDGDLKKDDNTSKENVEILAAAIKKKKLAATSSNDVTLDGSVLVEDDKDEDKVANVSSTVHNTVGKTDLSTPKFAAKATRKGAGTPKAGSAQKEKNGSATKLQIKLPLSSSKKKRRKSSLNQEQVKKNAETELSTPQEISSDDNEDIAAKQNPYKRTKFDDADAKATKTKCVPADQDKVLFKESMEEDVTIVLDSESEAIDQNRNVETSKPTKALHAKRDSKAKGAEIVAKSNHVESKGSSKSSIEESLLENLSDDGLIEIPDTSDDNEEEKDAKGKLEEETAPSDNDNEADDERDNLVGKPAIISSNVAVNSKTKRLNVELSQKDEKSTGKSAKVLTPKQMKLMEQRKKAREEKERKLQEEKLKKQHEKEEKEMARKREREEKEEQKRKEREEKEEQKRKEREEKERKRLAEIEAKNEEKRKKNEAKEEEMRKKDEERKRKEQEKEEAELKKKKAAQAFTKFFVAKTPSNNQIKNEDDSNTGDGTKVLAFRPFQIKGDMKLAPITRKNFTTEAKNRLDDLLGCKNKVDENESDDDIVKHKSLPKSQLYLSELRSGIILPGKWRRASTESKEDDVILVEDEMERVGQEIVEEIPAYVREEMRVKFYKFHDNRRPPYYGTWRKKSSFIKPRKPFAQDKKFFDYEVDSDDEWEEEEPGESLEDGSDEDKEKESEDDDYEVDNEWFVPHGHLSDEELQNEDEFGLGDDNTREAQKVKLQLLQQEFAQEMKKKTEKIKPRLIGCIWADINGNQPPECAKILWDNLEKKAMIFDDPPLIEEPENDRPSETNSPTAASNGNGEKTADKLKPISLSDNMIKDLTRLVHGNNHAKNFLINEYIAYVEKTEESIKNGGLRKPLKSVVRDKIDEIAEWQAVDANAASMQEIEQSNESSDKRKKKVKRRLCWVVKQEMLDKMNLSSLELQNAWQYTLPPKYVKPDKSQKLSETAAPMPAESNKTSTENHAKRNGSTPLAKSTKSHNTSTASNETSSNRTKLNASTTPKAKKRVPLLTSVARDQQISTPAKNKLISQFLQQKNIKSVEPSSPSTSANDRSISPNIVDDDVVVLD